MNEQRTTTEKDDTDSDDSILLYNKAFNSYPRDFDESNAEAAERHELIENKFEHLKRSKKMKRPKQSVIGDKELVEGTNYEGPLTLKQRMEISVKTQEALDNNDFDNIPIEYLVEGGDIFPEICMETKFPVTKTISSIFVDGKQKRRKDHHCRNKEPVQGGDGRAEEISETPNSRRILPSSYHMG